MFDPTTLTGIHTYISLFAIAAGIAVVAALVRGRDRPTTAATFLALAFLTSATGFLFSFNGVLPSHVVGAVAILVLLPAIFARYGAGLSGRWHGIYAATAVASLYFLVFVAVAQAFAKVPALQAVAPTQGAPAFAVTQGVVLIAFIGLGFASVRARPAV
ncbi:hypothetical protein [Xanthobacter oligotrophicus]|uniref:hypothetical protein n=1 Tax=Xanthobacter oligotrophicus TaxID=2607286 RepID=UPI0011F2BAE9|nr:hypothetical protein [Xanthobacter oligotrophicus]MCG5237305.1 hypothetical protein [Xanthobacter oligotrophicus]